MTKVKIKHNLTKEKLEDTTTQEGQEQSLTILDGSVLYTTNPNGFVEGSEVYVKTKEGASIQPAEGELNVTDKKRFEIKNGIIVMVTDTDEQNNQETIDQVEEQAMSEDDGLIPAYIELPVGVWTIGSKVYTVEEKTLNAGMDNECTSNFIVSMVDGEVESEVSEAQPQEELQMSVEEPVKEEQEETVVEEPIEEDSNEDSDLLNAIKSLSEQIKILQDGLESNKAEAEQMKKQIEEFGNQSAAQSFESTVQKIKSFDDMTPYEKYKFSRGEFN